MKSTTWNTLSNWGTCRSKSSRWKCRTWGESSSSPSWRRSMLSSSWATKKHNLTIRDATFYLSRNTSTFLNKKIKLNYQETRTTNNTQATQQQAANAIFYARSLALAFGSLRQHVTTAVAPTGLLQMLKSNKPADKLNKFFLKLSTWFCNSKTILPLVL